VATQLTAHELVFSNPEHLLSNFERIIISLKKIFSRKKVIWKILETLIPIDSFTTEIFREVLRNIVIFLQKDLFSKKTL